MVDTMTLEQVLLDMADCQGNRGVGHTYSRLTSWRLAIAAAIKQCERDKRDAARWRAFKELATAWHKEPLVNAKTGDGIAGIVRWTIWIHEAKDCATVWDAIDAAMAKESGNE